MSHFQPIPESSLAIKYGRGPADLVHLNQGRHPSAPPPPPPLEGNPELVLRKVHLDTLHTGCTPGVPSALSDVVEVFRTPHVL